MEAWTPDRKIVAAAAAAIIVYVVQLAAGIDVPPGIEAAIAVVVAYLVPSTRQVPLGKHPSGAQVRAEDLPTFNHYDEE